MSTMLDLALELFHEITSCLALEEIMALWICGNKALQWKLSKGNGVRNLAVHYSRSDIAPWPLLVQNFVGLKRFMINRPRYACSPEVWAGHFLTLDRNLDSLSIFLPNPFSAFDQLMAQDSGHFPNLKKLELVSTYGMGSLGSPIPRTVTNLLLGSTGHPLNSVSLRDFPPGLISLKCFATNLDIPTSPPLMFPEGLETLLLHTSRYLPLFPLIPATCNSITLHSRKRQYDSHFGMVPVPSIDDWRALTRLSCLKILRMDVSSSIDIEKAQLLPRTLESLYITLYDCDETFWTPSIVPFLPPNLKRFQGFWSEITKTVAKSLPRTFEMSFEEVDPAAVAYMPPKTGSIQMSRGSLSSEITAFPPFLQYLSLSNLDPMVAALLPPTLESLSIQNECTGATIKLLPRKLASLSVDQVPHKRTFDCIQSLEALPASLTELRLYTSFKPDTAKEIVRHLTPSQSSQNLPHYLETLSIGCLDFSQSNMADWLLGLPRYLAELNLLVVRLPRGAFSAFASNKLITSLQVRVLEGTEDGWGPCIESLPRNLTSLLLGYFNPSEEKDCYITDASLQRAPLSLAHINIPFSSLITQAGVSHLPRLTWLGFGNQKAKWFQPRPKPIYSPL